MGRGTKRPHVEDEFPATRRRLCDGDGGDETEGRSELQKDAAARCRRPGDENEWEDTSDDSNYYDDDDDVEESDVDDMADQLLDAHIEEEIIDDGDDDDDDDEDYADFQREAEAVTKGIRRVTFDDTATTPLIKDENKDDVALTVWRSDHIEDGARHESQKLEYSNKAYDSFFQLRTEYPCLSFDVLLDKDASSSGSSSVRYPLSLTLVCGSQAEEFAKNQLYVLRISNICRTKHDAASDSDSDDSYIGDEGDSEEEDDEGSEKEINNGEPIVHHRTIPHYGTANRVRCSHHDANLVAVWSDAGHVQVFDVSNEVTMLCDHHNWAKEQVRHGVQKNPQHKKPALLFCTPSTAHKTEGYGLDWNIVTRGVFASGDCNGSLFVWKPSDDGRWKATASSTSDAGGVPSIEEIQWSPTQADVLIATRVGGEVEVWDTRDMRNCKIHWKADPTDINVADWNRARQASHLLVTGADSGAVAVWDLRSVSTAVPIQRLPWHRGSITSVEFSLHNESVLAVTGDDGQCTLWDLSLERDPSEEQEVIGELFGRQDLTGIPDQLMFQHQGLEHAKEGHWHPQIPGMMITTDYFGLHLFRPMNWRSLMK